MKGWILLALAMPGLAFAQSPHLPEPLGACMAAADDPADCIGIVTGACMARPDGSTTVGMMFCNLEERDLWDQGLNAVYGQLMAGEKAADEEERKHFPEFANRADSLRKAQRAWIAFRDADCGYSYARWGAGSMRQIVGSACLLDMTAQRYLELASYLNAEDMR